MKAVALAPQLACCAVTARSQRGTGARAAPLAVAARTAGVPTWHLAARQQPSRVRAGAAQQTTAPAATQEQEEQALLQGVVEGTQLGGATLAVAYDAQQDGWSACAFHSAVDGQGPALVVALTVGGALIGGYNPLGWTGEGGDSDSDDAFLFFLDEASAELVKLGKVGGPGGALLRDGQGQGIWFGDALVVPLAPGKERAVKSKLGAFYARKPSTARHLFAEGAPVRGGARGTELASLQVWVAAQ